MNRLENNVFAFNCALGAKEGKLNFTAGMDTMNHIATDSDKNLVEVEVNTIDRVLKSHKVPSLLKIDVEGFESEVLRGGKISLSKSALKAIIIELNGSGNRYGYDEKNIHHELIELGFKPYHYMPFKRE